MNRSRYDEIAGTDGAPMTASMPSPDERAIMEFLKDLEDASDPEEVVRRHAAIHPHLAGEFADLASMQGRIKPPPADIPEEPRPERLGDFRVVGEIGRGGMGMIYEAVQEPFGRRVAVKTIRGDLRRIPGRARNRFLREQDVLARLHHSHIVPIHAAGCAGSLHYYAMQYIEGAALSQVIEAIRLFEATSPTEETPSMAELAERAERVRGEKTATQEQTADGTGAVPEGTGPSDGAMPVRGAGKASSAGSSPSGGGRLHLSMKYLRSVAKVMADAADALQHAHEAKILHRDVKPSNIMVDRQEHCWVLDFGLAALRAEGGGAGDGGEGAAPGEAFRTGPVFTNDVLGTPAYMAPEQFDRRSDARTDVWGLGVTLYELLTLRRPFRSPEETRSADPPKLPSLLATIPFDLGAIGLKAMHKDPGQRYQTAGELRDDLTRWLRFEPTRARPARTARRVGLWARRNPGWAAAIGVALLGATATVAAVIRSGEMSKKVFASDLKIADERRKATDAELRESRRAALMQRLQQQRLTAHGGGWSEDCWGLVREIKKYKGGEDLKEETAATLLGLDAMATKKSDFQADMLAYDPSGRWLLSAKLDRRNPSHEEVQIWDSTTDEVRKLPQGVHDGYGPLTFRADGAPLHLLWDKGGKGAVLLWDLGAQKAIRRLEWPLNPEETPMTWSMTPGGTFAGVVAGRHVAEDDRNAMRHVIIWETATGKLLRQFPTRAHDLELSPDASLVATSDLDGNIAIRTVASGESVASLSSGRTAIFCMAFGRDCLKRAGEKSRGWLLAVGGLGGDLTIWDVQAKIPRSYCRGSRYDVHRLAFSPDGMSLASVGRDHAMLWDVATGRTILRLGRRNWMSDLAFSPDGKTLAVGSTDGFGPGGLDVWRLEEARGQQVLRGLVGQVSLVCYSPKGRYLAAVSQNWQLAIWDLAAHRLLHVVETPKGRFAENAALTFDPEERRFAFASGDGAKLWDVQTGVEIRSWDLPSGFLDQMAFPAPDRLLLVRQESVDSRFPPMGPNDPDRSPRVCRVRDLLGAEPTKPLIEFKDFPRDSQVIMLTPDGQQVIVEGLEVEGREIKWRAIKMFDTRAGTEQWSLRSKPVEKNLTRIRSIDPTGRFLRMCDDSYSQAILVDVNSGRQVRTFKYGPMSLGPGVKDYLSSWVDHENDAVKNSLVGGDDEAILVTLGRDNQLKNPLFSADGTRLAWGNSDGTVTVCDIRQVQRRLAEVGLGW
jgi:serine/threonine protein kinase/WD40 repeat protein